MEEATGQLPKHRVFVVAIPSQWLGFQPQLGRADNNRELHRLFRSIPNFIHTLMRKSRKRCRRCDKRSKLTRRSTLPTAVQKESQRRSEYDRVLVSNDHPIYQRLLYVHKVAFRDCHVISLERLWHFRHRPLWVVQSKIP